MEDISSDVMGREHLCRALLNRLPEVRQTDKNSNAEYFLTWAKVLTGLTLGYCYGWCTTEITWITNNIIYKTG